MTSILDQQEGSGFVAYNGDAVDVVSGLPDNSIHYSIFSPPFAARFVFSDSERDMTNVTNDAEFMDHFKFLIPQLLRVTMKGRLLSFHCMNLTTGKMRNGVIGLVDFRGMLIRAFVEAGWVYHSEVCIWKDPVAGAVRTKALGLLHKQLKKDSCMSRQGLADYVVTMRKPGENEERVSHTNETFPIPLWQRYASPVWMDILQGDSLQHRSVREDKDEKHLCPLQLTVIRRCIELWTNPGDVVLSPFGGIGSEGYVALQEGRRACMVELKKSYYDQLVRNLQAVEHEAKHGQLGLFDTAEDATTAA